MTSEDFILHTEDRNDVLILRCPLPGCSWSMKREITRLWHLDREAHQHIIEEHDS